MSEFEKRFNEDGTLNPKYVDLLFEDPPIAGQKYCLISFVSPEKEIKQREMYLFEKFVEQYEISESLRRFNDFIGFISKKYNLNVNNVFADLDDFLNEEEDVFNNLTLVDKYKNFLETRGEELGKKYSAEHNFRTSTRGIKVRGNFSTQKEAEEYAVYLRSLEPSHDIKLGSVGAWMPWDPENIENVNYAEEKLNRLVQEKHKNLKKAKELQEERIRAAKEKNLAENMKRAAETGNKLTQVMDEQGNLVGVTQTVNFEEREAAPVV